MDLRRRPDPTTCDATIEPRPGRVSDNPFRSLDHAKQAMIARATAGVSPAALTLALADWFIHLIAAPGILLGERSEMTDLMAWNADSTRLPYRMHSEYLRNLFLENDLASDRYIVNGRPVSLRNIRVPMFVVGTERDHVAPWRSVYKIHHLTDTDITFVLTSGGHNAGIVSEPGHRHRQFRMSVTEADDMRVGPDEWAAAAQVHDGSWWPAWIEWLDEQSSVKRLSPPPMGLPDAATPILEAAPGTYVLQR